MKYLIVISMLFFLSCSNKSYEERVVERQVAAEPLIEKIAILTARERFKESPVSGARCFVKNQEGVTVRTDDDVETYFTCLIFTDKPVYLWCNIENCYSPYRPL